ncbi:uncharacterized protein LOC142341271 [Convolutriloba macropyga]|uniref:uncharacterized protein LOC142341271 n=1 Tax=Convolutriloba macropyga TaxID=536237 RepID=UPI003F524BA8
MICFTFLIFVSLYGTHVWCQGPQPPYTECPCLTVNKGVKPWKTELHDSFPECYVLCIDNVDRCVGFSYCPVTQKCEMFSQEILTYTFDSVDNQDCQSNPREVQPSLKKWYMLGVTQNCHALKQNDPALTSGNYTILVQGREVPVYCDMEAMPGATTYLRLAETPMTRVRYGGSAYVKYEEDPAVGKSIFYSLARLIIDGCLTYLKVDDQRFATGFLWNATEHSPHNSFAPETFYLSHCRNVYSNWGALLTIVGRPDLAVGRSTTSVNIVDQFFLDEMSSEISNVYSSTHNVILFGDYNINILKETGKQSLNNFIADNGLHRNIGSADQDINNNTKSNESSIQFGGPERHLYDGWKEP